MLRPNKQDAQTQRHTPHPHRLIPQRHHRMHRPQQNQSHRNRYMHQQPPMQPLMQLLLPHQLPRLVANIFQILHQGMRRIGQQSPQSCKRAVCLIGIAKPRPAPPRSRLARRETQGPWGIVLCELRTVNHRYLEVGLRLPEEFRSLELETRQLMAAALRRGKVADEGVGYFGLHNAVFALGDTFFEVISPLRASTAAGRQLDRRGADCGYMLMAQLEDLAALLGMAFFARPRPERRPSS